MLTSKDCPERPRYGDSASKITFRRAKGIGNTRAFQEEEREESEHFGANTSRLLKCVNAECLESGDNDENCRPAVIQTEGEVNENWIWGGKLALELRHVNKVD